MKKIIYIILFAVSLSISCQKIGSHTDDNLIAYWSFNETPNNMHGNQYDGILMGDASFANGINGKALKLDGAGDYMEIDNGFNLPYKYSVSVWIKTEEIDRSWPAIFAKYETSGYGPFDFDLHYDKVNVWISDGTGSGGYKSVDSYHTVVANEWLHIVWTVDDTNLKLYINGALDITATVPTMTQNMDRVLIGRQALIFNEYPGYQFKGLIDELKIYSIALTQNQVLDEYHRSADNK